MNVTRILRSFFNFENRRIVILGNVLALIIVTLNNFVLAKAHEPNHHLMPWMILLCSLNLIVFFTHKKSAVPYLGFTLLCFFFTFGRQSLPHIELNIISGYFLILFFISTTLKPLYSIPSGLILVIPHIYKLSTYPYDYIPINQDVLAKVSFHSVAAIIFYFAWELNRTQNRKVHFKRVRRVLTSLNQRRQEIQGLNEFKNKLINKTSHEIRTPLNVIYGEIQNYEREQEIDIQLLKAKVGDLIDLMDNIHELKSTQSEIQPIKPTWIAHQQIIKSINEILSGVTDDSHQVQFLNNQQEYHYLLDLHLLSLGLKPIIKNCFDHTRKGLVNIEFFIIKKSDKKAVLHIMMEDSGHGVAPSQIQELFFPEDQPEKAPPTIGMGLSIARHYLIERLNANWLVAPGEHGGLKVEVKLEVPLQQFDNLRLRQIEDQLIGRQVLIVDDIKLNHKVLAKVLSGFHVESKSVTSGQEAIDICQLQQFDYILMDLRMPEMNGFEAAQRIIENGYEGSIIAVTAEKGGSTVSQALEAGMKDVIFKPVDFEEIKQSLITHMQAKS